MRVSRGVFLAAFALIALAGAAALVGGAQAATSSSSRLDPGPPIEARLGEGFEVFPTDIWTDVDAGIDVREVWWDIDNRTDTYPNSNPTDDHDVNTSTFHHPGRNLLGTVTFTLWVNFTDNVVASASRQILIVENQPPAIAVSTNPTGFVGEPISFTVAVTDPDSPETTLQYFWDFDVAFDSFGDGNPENDVDSTLRTGVTHVYTAVATYTAKLTVRDDFNASKDAFITVTVQRPPGITERVVEGKDYFTENVTIRTSGWVSYHMVVKAGRLYQYDISVNNDAAVYVMVQFSQQQFDQYRFRTSQTAYEAQWSHVNSRDPKISVQFRPDRDGEVWITVDNGYLLQLGGKQAETVVTVQDVDRNNLIANIPLAAWVGIVVAVAGVVAFFGIRAYIAGAEVRRGEREKAAIQVQEKAAAKNELDAFLSNPDAAAQRARAPPPAPIAAPIPAPQQGPRGPAPAPRPAGPAPPPGYAPRPAGSPPPVRSGPTGPQPPPGYAGPRPAPTAGPRPAPAPMPAPAPQAAPEAGPASEPAPAAAAAGTCGSCGMEVEAAWKICPSCGTTLHE